jgi:ankyrin repeat protein
MKANLCPCCPLLLKTLLRLGADPCLLTPSEGTAAIHMAAANGASAETLKLLLAADPEHRVDLRDTETNSTPLMRAVLKGVFLWWQRCTS